MKPKTVEKKVREPIVLSKTAYLRLLRLLRWLEDTPEEVELGDHTIDQIEAAIDRYLPDLGEESVTVELTEGRLGGSVRGRRGGNPRPDPGVKGMNAKTYVTTYCNHPHSLTSGKPVGHDCFIIPPAALAAEREGDTEKAIELIEAGKTSFVFGVPSLPPCNSKGKEAK